MKNVKTATKEISILHIYRWKSPINRICFEIESTSDSEIHYNVCFNHDASHGSCTCDGFEKWHKVCLHLKGLRPVAQAYFESRKPAAPIQPVQREEDWKESSKFGTQPVQKLETAPSGRLVPMR